MISREYHDRSPSTQGYLGCYISPFDASPRPQSASLRSRPTPSTRRADRVGEVGHVGSKSGENHMRKSFSGETLLAQGKKQGLRTCWPALGARLLQRASAFERFGFLVKNAGSVKQILRPLEIFTYWGPGLFSKKQCAQRLCRKLSRF